jgi:hypothetical protein
MNRGHEFSDTMKSDVLSRIPAFTLPRFQRHVMVSKASAYRLSFQSHSAGQSKLPQMSCTKPRSCLSLDRSRDDGWKSWLIQAQTRSLRVEVSSPRAASAPLLICSSMSTQREFIGGTDLFQHIFSVISVKCPKLRMKPRQSLYKREVATLQAILSEWRN